MSDNLGAQFTSYRGMIMGKGEPPSDDEILGRLNPRVQRNNGLNSVGSPYGPHWTDTESVARRFAGNPNAGGYQTMPPVVRKIANTPGKPWGVVLEAHHGPTPLEEEVSARTGDPNYRGYRRIPYSEHENEVAVWRPTIHEVVAHITEGHRAENVRSLQLPNGHWDPDPAFHQRAIARWQKERQEFMR